MSDDHQNWNAPQDSPETQQMTSLPTETPVAEPAALEEKQPWPSKAKATVAVLVVVALLAGAGALTGWLRDTSDDDAVTSEDLDAATTRAETAEGQVVELEMELEAAQGEIEARVTERDEALADLAGVQAELDESEALLATATQDIADRDATIAQLEAAIAALADPFPVAIVPDLPSADVDGQYSIALTEVRCFNLTVCGSPPGLANASLTRTATQLLLNVPGQFQIAMTGTDRQLFGESIDQTLIPQCADVPRPQSTRIALHAGSGQVNLNASIDLSTIGGSVIVTAPVFGECEAGEVWYAVTLTRVV